MNKIDLLVAKLIALDKIDANRICLSDLDFSFNDESEYFEFLYYLFSLFNRIKNFHMFLCIKVCTVDFCLMQTVIAFYLTF